MELAPQDRARARPPQAHRRLMGMLVELDGVAPTIGEGVYLAPTAVVIGDVTIADNASVWFGAVLRGDLSRIEIGPRCSIQDNAVIHCAIDLPTIISEAVTIGHGAKLEGCVVDYQQLRERYLEGSVLRP